MKKRCSLKCKESIKFYSLLNLFFWLPFLLFSIPNLQRETQQNKSVVTGVVMDSGNKEPIYGATVVVIGENRGVITDADGSFSIEVTKDAVELEVSFVGYKRHTVRASVGAPLNVNMEVNTEILDEVVVVGYGTTTRRDLTGAVGKPDIKEMQKAPVSNFEEALAGRVAGVMVMASDGQPGSDMNIVIRGNNSVTQDNSPLYVVDGFPIEASEGNFLNPEEIESIEVLKDASATAIYGARGANGVILITTKQGKMGAPVITYNGWVGLHQVTKRQDVLDPYEFVRYQLELNPTVYTPIYLSTKTLEDYKDEKGVNWQDEVFRDALVHNHNFSIRGGSEGTRYSVSGSIVNQNGIIKNSGFEKYQGRVSLTQRVNAKLHGGVNLNYTATKKYGTIAAEQEVSPTANLMYTLWGYRPVTGRVDDDLLNELYDPDLDYAIDYRINPIFAVNNEYNPLYSYNLRTNGFVEYLISNDLKLRITGGFSKITQRREIFNNSNSRLGNPNTNNKVNGSITNMETTNYLNENTLTYSKRFKGGHNLKVLGGFTLQDSYYTNNSIYSINIPNESLGIAGIGQGTLSSAPTINTSYSLLSYLGRIDYNFKSKYLLTASIRADGSSKFLKGNRWAYFPSASIAWRFVDEKFMKNVSFLNEGKLRVGIGATGNNRIPAYSMYTGLDVNRASGYSIGNSPEIGVIPVTLGNPNLKWESTVQSNVGLDLSFLKDRITLTTDYYYKKTKDLLLRATLAPSMGFNYAYRNVGEVSNSGLEITLNTENVKTNNFTWSSSFNISFNKNKVLALNDDEPSLATSILWGNFNNAYPYIAVPGQPIALFYGYLFDGIYQYDDFDKSGSIYTLKNDIPNNGTPRENIKPGDIKFKDINGDGVVDDYDLTIIGNPNPKHIESCRRRAVCRNTERIAGIIIFAVTGARGSEGGRRR